MRLARERGLLPPKHPCTHWCFGVVLFQQPVFVNNTKAVLQSKWRSWTDSALRDNTISRLAEKHRSGHFYGIARRHLFTHPVQVRARTRNYGDGWIPSPELERRCCFCAPRLGMC